MTDGVELMLSVAVVFVRTGLTVCCGRGSEAIAHTVERRRIQFSDKKMWRPRSPACHACSALCGHQRQRSRPERSGGCTVSYAITQRSSSDVTARPLVAYGANGASEPKLPPSTQTKDPSGRQTASNVLTPPCSLHA
ncbi:unnamed protein product [Pleuronectes platessa]|uniref:Secreted protein n=1 Tax=Pleuronectes platessa TaxID=8262 RepID=A0A9N7U7B5_PLEPL|nr:unnamed protein product [Pleuronectes platessa]